MTKSPRPKAGAVGADLLATAIEQHARSTPLTARARRTSTPLSDAEFASQKTALLAAPTSATRGPMNCGRCGKPQSPAWRDQCKHCRARYAEFPPVARAS